MHTQSLYLCSSQLLRIVILHAFNVLTCETDFNDRIDQVPSANVIQNRVEELSLTRWRYIRNDDHQAGVECFLLVKGEEVESVVRDERIVPVDDQFHQLPVFGTAEAEIVHMIRYLSTAMRQFD